MIRKNNPCTNFVTHVREYTHHSTCQSTLHYSSNYLSARSMKWIFFLPTLRVSLPTSLEYLQASMVTIPPSIQIWAKLVPVIVMHQMHCGILQLHHPSRPGPHLLHYTHVYLHPVPAQNGLWTWRGRHVLVGGDEALQELQCLHVAKFPFNSLKKFRNTNLIFDLRW